LRVEGHLHELVDRVGGGGDEPDADGGEGQHGRVEDVDGGEAETAG
jgi:hypothetical protein